MASPNLPMIAQSLAIQTMDQEMVKALVEESGTAGLTPFDLDRVSMPGDGAVAYTVPTEAGPEPMKELPVIIVHHHKYRSLYAEKRGGVWEPLEYDPMNVTSPQCSSWDGVTGNGDPGGSCASCPLSRGRTKTEPSLCKPSRFIYGLFVDNLLPALIVQPRTSLLQENSVYLAKEPFKAGRPLYGFVTLIGLTDRKRGPGKVATFKRGPHLTPEQFEAVGTYARAFRSSLVFPVTYTAGIDSTAPGDDPTQPDCGDEDDDI